MTRAAAAPTTPFASVWFDCDSTLSTIEGIDELARLTGDDAVLERLVALTNAAMDGSRSLDEVYEARLAALQPSRDRVAAVGRRYVETVVPDVERLVGALHALGKQVGIVSGGVLPAVAVLAEHLDIDASRVHAVDLRFAADGRYVDFDRDSPLWKNGGKIEVLGAVAEAARPLAFVGDGVTDLEAGDLCDRFVGFGGVARREAVERAAPFYVTSPSLAPVLALVCTTTELDELRDRGFVDLVARATADA